MKKVIIATAITTLFSTMSTANSGLADRISEARSYPNKIASTKSKQMRCMKEKQTHKDMSKSQVIRGVLREVSYEGNDSGNDDWHHTYS